MSWHTLLANHQDRLTAEGVDFAPLDIGDDPGQFETAFGRLGAMAVPALNATVVSDALGLGGHWAVNQRATQDNPDLLPLSIALQAPSDPVFEQGIPENEQLAGWVNDVVDPFATTAHLTTFVHNANAADNRVPIVGIAMIHTHPPQAGHQPRAAGLAVAEVDSEDQPDLAGWANSVHRRFGMLHSTLKDIGDGRPQGQRTHRAATHSALPLVLDSIAGGRNEDNLPLWSVTPGLDVGLLQYLTGNAGGRPWAAKAWGRAMDQDPLTRLACAHPPGEPDRDGTDLIEGLLEPGAGELFGAELLRDAQAQGIHLRAWHCRGWHVNDAAARDSVEVDLIVMLVNTDLSIWTIPRDLDEAVAQNLVAFQIYPAVQGVTATLTRTMIDQHGLRMGGQPIVAPVRHYVRNMGLAASAWHAVVAQAPHPPDA